MTEPVLFGLPVSMLFLYFIIYSFLGWAMETCYCSIGERRFVARGFLYGPICPIYGVGVLMMICWFAPLTGNPFLFYVVATVCMSTWEYLVGWLLETTTRIKYWDYGMYRFNLHGRICLWVCLMWGVLAYGVIFWIHPAVAGVVEQLPVTAVWVTAVVLALILVADTVATIRELALVSRMVAKLGQTGDELRVQLALGKLELSDRLEDAREAIADKLEDARESLEERFGTVKERAESVEKLRARYEELLVKAERASRHLRYSYSGMTSRRWSQAMADLGEAGRRAKAEWRERRAARRAGEKAEESDPTRNK